MAELKITRYQRSDKQKNDQKAFYTELREISKTRPQWQDVDAAEPEDRAIIHRNNVKHGRCGWTQPKYLDVPANYQSVKSRSGTHEIRVRIFEPPSRDGTTALPGVFLHMHGGGWVFGSPDNEEVELTRLSERTGYIVASVDYRLAPKHPYPAAVDDCVDAALFFLSSEAKGKYGTLSAVGGESAGAHLSACVLFTLRAHGIDVRSQFTCALLYYAPWDLGLSPSARSNEGKFILSRIDVEEFVKAFTRGQSDVQNPKISPLYEADFSMLPPAIFVVGEKDRLFDDSLFAAIKWHMGGNEAELVTFPDEWHAFTRTGGALSDPGMTVGEEFVKKHARNRSRTPR